MPDLFNVSQFWISIHDVMPSTLAKTLRIIDFLTERNVPGVTLLVVPGKNWKEQDINVLRHLQNQGHELVGHGWYHHVLKRKSLYHKLHGLFFSRMVAEHLSLSEDEIAQLIERCHKWFRLHEMHTPSLYVPPAWAMGHICRSRLRELPFTRYEYLTGVYDVSHDRFHRLPLLGFEADTNWRKIAIRLSNSLNLLLAQRAEVCRIAIHPHDLDLLMRSDLDRMFG